VRGKKGYVTVPDGQGVRYRQPPGPANALGRMKVVMPNNYAIYLHDTPSKSLFNRQARAFSHGCIRTQNALGFAELLLANPAWDRTAIDEAIRAGKTVQADATTPTQVYIAYFTAAAAAGSTELLSYSDVYGRDKPILAALNDTEGSRAVAVSTAGTR
jgi:murein L,D-transpeptidase YcbB/YkuD